LEIFALDRLFRDRLYFRAGTRIDYSTHRPASYLFNAKSRIVFISRVSQAE
jgi:hypothetical protein